MKNKSRNIYISIATIYLVAMLFSCTNNTTEVRDFLADKNKHIGIAVNINHALVDGYHVGQFFDKFQVKLDKNN